MCSGIKHNVSSPSGIVKRYFANRKNHYICSCGWYIRSRVRIQRFEKDTLVAVAIAESAFGLPKIALKMNKGGKKGPLLTKPNLGKSTLKSSKYGIALILLVPIGMVAGPVLWEGMRSEIAHWYLAAAANAIELGTGDANKSIEAARAWDPEVGRLPDYWNVRLRQLKNKPDLSIMDVLHEVPEERKQEIAEKLARLFGSTGDYALAAEVMRVLLGGNVNQSVVYWDVLISQALEEAGESRAIERLREAISANPDRPELRKPLAEKFATILERREDFASTLEAYKLWFGEKYDRTVTNLNQIAYARALANEELDEALIDIDEALGYRPDDPSLRDTRAWIYYRLGRYEEALADADFSVKALEVPSIANWWEGALEWLQVKSDTGGNKSTESKSADSKSPQEGDAAPMPTVSTQVADQVADQVAEVESSDSSPPIVMLDIPKEYLTRGKVGEFTWALGVMRYHRAVILTKLGRNEEAEADWKWIEEKQLPPDDRLHKCPLANKNALYATTAPTISVPKYNVWRALRR